MSLVLQLLMLVAVAVAVPGVVTSCLNAVDRGEPVRLRASVIARLVREYASHLAMGPLILPGIFDHGPTPAPGITADHPPVLLVPGYGMNRSCMMVLAHYLRQRGWKWAWAANNRRAGEHGVPGLAAGLARSVEDLLRASGARQIDIVAHSMGGVIAGYFINELGGAAQVRRLVTIGTPWHGTRLWVFGQRREAADMAPDSPVLQAACPPAVPTLSVWTRTDNLVFPFTSAHLPERDQPPLRNVEIAEAGHLEMLLSPRVWRVVRDALAAPAALAALEAPVVPEASDAPQDDAPTQEQP